MYCFVQFCNWFCFLDKTLLFPPPISVSPFFCILLCWLTCWLPFFYCCILLPCLFFVFLLFKYILRGLDTPFSHSHTPPAPLWSPWSDLPPCCLFLPQAYTTKHVIFSRFGLFSSCFFCRPLPYDPMHPSICTNTHMNSFLTIFGKTHKTSCPGKFPRP